MKQELNKINPLNGASGEPTMSSLEIAELCDKQHKNVMRDIRVMIEQLGDGLKVEPVEYHDAKGETRPMYLLDYDKTMCLVSGYEVKLRMAIIKRWRELEAQQSSPALQLPDFTNPVEAARAWADEVEAKQSALLQIEQQRPAVEFAERIAGADKGVQLGNFAKAVGIGPKKIFSILRDLRILMRGGERHNLPYQEYVERGYFTVRQSTYEANAERRISHTPLITGKGEQWLTHKLLDAGMVKVEVRHG